jgi:hypothetical protein
LAHIGLELVIPANFGLQFIIYTAMLIWTAYDKLQELARVHLNGRIISGYLEKDFTTTVKTCDGVSYGWIGPYTVPIKRSYLVEKKIDLINRI